MLGFLFGIIRAITVLLIANNHVLFTTLFICCFLQILLYPS